MASLTLPSTKIRVLCVDDSPDLAEMLGQCIDREPDMETVGCLHSADNLLAHVERTHADVVVLDMSMPGRDPVAALTDLAASVAADPDPRLPGAVRARVIAYSGRYDQQAVDQTIEAGAWGYISKDAEIPAVLNAIRNVARGATAFETGL